MAIDFSFPEDVELVRHKVREFLAKVVRPAEEEIERNEGDRKTLVEQVIKMRQAAQEWGLWLPHMPAEYGGMGLGHVAMAAVSAEAAKSAARLLRLLSDTLAFSTSTASMEPSRASSYNASSCRQWRIGSNGCGT